MAKGIPLADQEIERLNAGETITTCEPVERLEFLAPGLAQKMVSWQGKTIRVVGSDESKSLPVQMIRVFETTYGKPDPDVLLGMGYGQDLELFHKSYREFWHTHYPELNLGAQSKLLIVQYQKLEQLLNEVISSKYIFRAKILTVQ